MFREEELYNNSYKRDPFTDISSVQFKTRVKEKSLSESTLSFWLLLFFYFCLFYFVLPEKAKDHRRKTEEDVRNQKGCEHIRLPISPIQDQQVSAKKQDEHQEKK